MSAWMSATAHRSELAQYAELEYSPAEAGRIEAGRFQDSAASGAKEEEPVCRVGPGREDPVPEPTLRISSDSAAPPRPAHSSPVAAPSYGAHVLARAPGAVPLR